MREHAMSSCKQCIKDSNTLLARVANTPWALASSVLKIILSFSVSDSCQNMQVLTYAHTRQARQTSGNGATKSKKNRVDGILPAWFFVIVSNRILQHAATHRQKPKYPSRGDFGQLCDCNTADHHVMFCRSWRRTRLEGHRGSIPTICAISNRWW